jgi:hypothetical protein
LIREGLAPATAYTDLARLRTLIAATVGILLLPVSTRMLKVWVCASSKSSSPPISISIQNRFFPDPFSWSNHFCTFLLVIRVLNNLAGGRHGLGQAACPSPPCPLPYKENWMHVVTHRAIHFLYIPVWIKRVHNYFFGVVENSEILIVIYIL